MPKMRCNGLRGGLLEVNPVHLSTRNWKQFVLTEVLSVGRYLNKYIGPHNKFPNTKF
jgi:hypothetical protein